MKMWLYIFCIFTRILIILTEVITLVKDNSMTCALTEHSVYSALYITRSTEAGALFIDNNRTLVEITNWVNDDWKVIHSSDSNHGPVTDIRWENYEYNRSKKLPPLGSKTTSFSVCFNPDLKIILRDASLKQYYSESLFPYYSQNDKKIETFCQWTHHVIAIENNLFMIKQPNETLFKQDINYTAKWFAIGNLNTPIKLHNYDFKYSNFISGTDISYLNISNISNSTQICISMFVSLDEACYLKIILDSDNQLANKTETGFNKEGDFKRWKKIEIENNYNGTGKLFLIRGRLDNGKSGYWAVDNIHICRPKLDIYKIILPPNNTSEDVICKVLNTTSENNKFCREPGYLGSNCSTRCKDVLGNSFSFCENHMICLENNTCQCAWGFQKPHCKERCRNGYWGLDCRLKCKDGCEICDEIEGCTKCKKRFFGNDCSAKYPVLLNRPVLVYTSEDMLIINFDMEFGVNETSPNFYQIQYKEVSAKIYRNYSNKERYSNSIESVTMPNMLIKTESYHIRMILLIKDHQAFVDAVPQLTIYKKSLTAINVSDLEIMLHWNPPNKESIGSYILEYQCEDFCSDNFHKNSTQVTNNTTTKIEILKRFQNCLVKLFVNTETQKQLIDQIVCRDSTKEVKESELPKNIILKNNTITVEFDTCDKFSGALNYDIMYKCSNTWCDSNDKGNLTIALNKHEKSVEKDIEQLKAFAVYEIEVTARRTQTFIKTYLQTTPSSKPFAVANLSLYCSNDSALWIRWQKPYPPTGVIENYNITFQKKGSETHLYLFSNSQCDFWDNFLCATITGLDNQTLYNISVRAKNSDVSQWSDARFLTSSTLHKGLDDPECKNIKIRNVYAEILISLIITIAIVLLLGFFYYAFRHKRIQSFIKPRRRYHQNILRSEDMMPLQVINDEEKSTIIQLQNFENYVKQNAMSAGLIKQFKSLLVEKTEACTVALKSENINKNKDKDNIPYEFNRVILKTMAGIGTGDYINANYVDGIDRAKAYIICEGPKFYTVRDFWRMIWQEQIETIVMATNFMNERNRMCAEYWTESLDAIFDCGEMTIKLIKEVIYEHHIHRIFKVQYTRYSRRIQHFQLKWSVDNETLFYSKNAVPLVKQIREISENSSPPILIHSGFGLNRTGTLLLCDLALQMIKVKKSVDFCTLLKSLRRQRPNMVNKVEYYVLAHLIVLECIMEQNSPFKKDMEEHVNTMVIKQQLSYLKRLYWHDTVISTRVVQPAENNSLRPIFVEGYKKPKKYLITKQPTKQSVTEFWIQISNEKISHILFLNGLENNLWPHIDDDSEVIVTVRQLKDARPDNTQCYKQTQLLLLTCDKATKDVLHKSEIYFLELKDWNSRQLVPTSSENILNVIEYVNKVTRENTTPVLLGCRDGITASGLFAALSYVIEKYESEFEFDVCNALRILKRGSSQFMNNPRQIKFLYRAILEYKQNYDTYACIKE